MNSEINGFRYEVEILGKVGRTRTDRRHEAWIVDFSTTEVPVSVLAQLALEKMAQLKVKNGARWSVRRFNAYQRDYDDTVMIGTLVELERSVRPIEGEVYQGGAK